jgi:hypothetical protein
VADNVVKDILFGTVGYLIGRRENVRPRKMPVPFRNKIVIAVPSWSVPLVAIATGIGVYFSFSHIANVIELLIVASSFIFAYEMHRMVQRLRVRIHELSYDIGNEDLDDRYGPWMDDELPIAEKPAKRLTLNGKK